MKNFKQKAMDLHRQNRGKIEVRSKIPLGSRDDLSLAYTPGVASVCRAISAKPSESRELTNRANTVAIVSDGTAVLGLGNIGPEAAMPVMEGKSAIFKKFAHIDAYPLCVNTAGTEGVVGFCRALAPSVAGINLEDIKAPECFEVLDRLEKELDIPVFHDDQDGTAIVTLAALINACRVTGKVMPELKVVVNGAGAAGIAITRLLLSQGVKSLTLLDSAGALYKGRSKMNKYKQDLASKTNQSRLRGGLEDVLPQADVFIGVSRSGVLSPGMVRTMNPEPVILAMANPDPEIDPQKAKQAGAAVVGTGRSDQANQINNALVFPGIFRGLLDGSHVRVTRDMKISAALALAYSLQPRPGHILPNIRNKRVVPAIAQAVAGKKR